MADVTVEIDAFCANCGEVLDSYGTKGTGGLDVRPCPNCLNEELDIGKNKGYDIGYDEGYADAEKQNG